MRGEVFHNVTTHTLLNQGRFPHSPIHKFVMHTYVDSIHNVNYLQNIGSGNGKKAVD